MNALDFGHVGSCCDDGVRMAGKQAGFDGLREGVTSPRAGRLESCATSIWKSKPLADARVSAMLCRVQTCRLPWRPQLEREDFRGSLGAARMSACATFHAEVFDRGGKLATEPAFL